MGKETKNQKEMEADLDDFFFNDVTFYFPQGTRKITLLSTDGKKKKGEGNDWKEEGKVSKGIKGLGMSIKSIVEGTWDSIRGFMPSGLIDAMTSIAKVFWATISIAGRSMKYFVVTAKNMAIGLVTKATAKVFSFCKAHPFRCLKGVVLLSMTNSLLSATYLAKLGCNFTAQQLVEKTYTTLPSKSEKALEKFSTFLTKLVQEKAVPDRIWKIHREAIQYLVQFLKNFDPLHLPESEGGKALFDLAVQDLSGSLKHLDPVKKDKLLGEHLPENVFEGHETTLKNFLGGQTPEDLENAINDYLVLISVSADQRKSEAKTLEVNPTPASSLSGLNLMKHNAAILENFFSFFKPDVHNYISKGCDAVLGMIAPVLQTCDLAIEDAGETVLSFSAEKLASYLPFMGNAKKFLESTGLADSAVSKFNESAFSTYLQAARSELASNPALVARNIMPTDKTSMAEFRDLLSFGSAVHGRAKLLERVPSTKRKLPVPSDEPDAEALSDVHKRAKRLKENRKESQQQPEPEPQPKPKPKKEPSQQNNDLALPITPILPTPLLPTHSTSSSPPPPPPPPSVPIFESYPPPPPPPPSTPIFESHPPPLPSYTWRSGIAKQFVQRTVFGPTDNNPERAWDKFLQPLAVSAVLHMTGLNGLSGFGSLAGALVQMGTGTTGKTVWEK